MVNPKAFNFKLKCDKFEVKILITNANLEFET